MKKVKLSLEELEKNSDAISNLLSKRGLSRIKGGQAEDLPYMQYANPKPPYSESTQPWPRPIQY
ncbi:MAG: hypothetical protein LBE13_13250 [Bacteroidales bacterium]|jgi:hypothetical protein|nr:hypothetical protein [Bacteroidales bacterium]